jgi:NAD(P)-dependent dehydrogenase (short-subunit alcohol dehydrogenase family)
VNVSGQLTDPISVLVNDAGISHIGTVESTSEAGFDRVFRVNVKGFYNCLRACIAHLRNKGGFMLNMASIAGVFRAPGPFRLFGGQGRNPGDDEFRGERQSQL